MLPLFSVFPTVGLNFVLIAFVIVVLGGMGSIEGALLGGFCVGVVQSLSAYYVAPAFGQLFFFPAVSPGHDLSAQWACSVKRARPTLGMNE